MVVDVEAYVVIIGFCVALLAMLCCCCYVPQHVWTIKVSVDVSCVRVVFCVPLYSMCCVVVTSHIICGILMLLLMCHWYVMVCWCCCGITTVTCYSMSGVVG